MHKLTFKLEDKTLVVNREGENAKLRVNLDELEADTRYTLEFDISAEDNQQLFIL